jgi:acyl-CoA synthetase (AMP-forming)/AMP-acid ligase II
VKQTPDISFDNTQALQDYVARDEDHILGRRHAVPVEFPAGQSFLAGSALLRVNFRWKLPDGAPQELEEARRLFAMHTCNGCHFSETGTQFVHIVPRRADETARLSQFLRTPETGDLALREQDLRNLVERGRPYEEQRLPLQFVH